MRSALGKARRSTRKGTRSFYSFPRARDAVAATVEAHRGLESYQWPDGVTVRVRIGLHTGEPAMGEEGNTGLDVASAARIAGVGRGGQVLLSETTRALTDAKRPPVRTRGPPALVMLVSGRADDPGRLLGL